MKLDPRNIRHLSAQDWRVLAAVEQGTRNHEVVPTTLITTLSGLSPRSIPTPISHLAKLGLIARTQNAKYDGYRLTYGGLDYLALHAHVKSGALLSVGQRIGVGKEADVMVCAAPDIDERTGKGKMVLKMHRLGRISFRAVKEKRDYLRGRKTGNWMYLSRLAAQKENAVLEALHSAGYPVPTPRGWNRHTVLMDLVDGLPLRSISSVPDPAALYGDLVDIVVRLARHGLIHGDFNEFNIIITEKPIPDSDQVSLVITVIDFPQAVSTSHTNAVYYFDRDIACLKRFFERRFHFVPEEDGPHLEEILKEPETRRLDVEVEASGFSKKMAGDLQKYIEENVDGEVEAGEVDYDEEVHDEDPSLEGDDQPEDDNSEPKDRLSEWIDGIPGSDLSSSSAQLILNDMNPDTEKAHTEQQPHNTIESGLNKLDLSNHVDDSVSVAASTRSRKVVNPLKASRGWAI